MLTAKFSRTIEDFTCEHCGVKVKGNGYTNHCPKCLWSKHVDEQPGDRQATCGGLMEPIGTFKEGANLKLLLRCVACGHERPNKILPVDNFEEVLRLTASQLP